MKCKDFNIKIGIMECGPLNKITDVPGVQVGHATVHKGNIHTGVTVVQPQSKNIFLNKLYASTHVINGYGKSVGLMQIDELGQLESPILLTNTFSVGVMIDALIDRMIIDVRNENVELKSFNSTVLECNDSYINDIQKKILDESYLNIAFEGLTDDFEEGSVGGGTGMICHQLKGGIGSASRIMKFGDNTYTLGVLVQSNQGMLDDLIVNEQHIGKEYRESVNIKSDDSGSIIIIIATDLPMTSRQLKRIAKRATNGISRVGCYSGHGSGEVVLAFSTANSIPRYVKDDPIYQNKIVSISEDCMNIPFRAVVEATEEAVLNSMLASDAKEALNGQVIKSLKDIIGMKKL